MQAKKEAYILGFTFNSYNPSSLVIVLYIGSNSLLKILMSVPDKALPLKSVTFHIILLDSFHLIVHLQLLFSFLSQKFTSPFLLNSHDNIILLTHSLKLSYHSFFRPSCPHSDVNTVALLLTKLILSKNSLTSLKSQFPSFVP